MYPKSMNRWLLGELLKELGWKSIKVWHVYDDAHSISFEYSASNDDVRDIRGCLRVKPVLYTDSGGVEAKYNIGDGEDALLSFEGDAPSCIPFTCACIDTEKDKIEVRFKEMKYRFHSQVSEDAVSILKEYGLSAFDGC